MSLEPKRNQQLQRCVTISRRREKRVQIVNTILNGQEDKSILLLIGTQIKTSAVLNLIKYSFKEAATNLY